jgi:hypothetical protein
MGCRAMQSGIGLPTFQRSVLPWWWRQYKAAERQHYGQEVETHKPYHKEAKKIEIHPDNLNRNDDVSLITLWKALIHGLKERKQFLAKNTKPLSFR